MASKSQKLTNEHQNDLSSKELYQAVISMLPEEVKSSTEKLDGKTYSPYIDNALTLWREVNKKAKEVGETKIIIEQSLNQECFGHCPEWPEGETEISYSTFKKMLKYVADASAFESVLLSYFYLTIANKELLTNWFAFDGKKNTPQRPRIESVKKWDFIGSPIDGEIPEKFSHILQVYNYSEALHQTYPLYYQDLTDERILQIAERKVKKLKSKKVSFQDYKEIGKNIYFLARYQGLALAHYKAQKGGKAKNRKK